MLLRKRPSVVALGCTCSASLASSTSSASTQRPRTTISTASRCPSRNPPRPRCARAYTTSRDDQPSRDNKPSDSDTTPPAWPTKPHPTPYDIFAIPHNAPYTKKRFYQLVKLYHPDLSSSSYSSQHDPNPSSLPTPQLSSSASSSPPSTLSPAARLERYRLVVAANTLLSDPSKRQLYDLHGLGWSADSPSRAPDLRTVDRAWRQQPGSAAANATWEDWQRWHDARSRDGGKQQPVYMPNGLLAILVATACVAAAMVQGSRAESAGVYYVESQAQQHAAIGNDVRRSAQASAGLTQDQRVDRFLRDRENVAYAFMPRHVDERKDPQTTTTQPTLAKPLRT